MDPSRVRTVRIIGLVALLVMGGLWLIGLALPWIVFGLALCGAGASGLWLGERARVIRRRNST